MIVFEGTQTESVRTLVKNGAIVVSNEERAKKIVKKATQYNVVAGYKPWKQWYAVFVKKRLGK